MNRKYRITMVGLVVLALLIGASAQEWLSIAVAASDQQLPGSKLVRVAAPGFRAAPGVLPLVPVPGGPAFYSLSSWAFNPEYSDYQYYHGSDYLMNTGTEQNTFGAAISLPNGVTVNRFILFFTDMETSLDLSATLRRYSLTNHSVETMAQLVSSGDTSGQRYVETTSITSPVIDQQSYSYVVEVSLPPDNDDYVDIAMTDIRIDYGYALSLPLVRK